MLSTVAYLKGHLGIPESDTSKDTLLSFLIAGASKYVESQTGRVFELQEFTEVHSGDDQVQLVLKQYPVTEISSLVVNSEEVDIEAETSAGDLVIDDGGVIVRRDGFRKGLKNVRVVYSAGYVPRVDDEESGEPPNLPEDLELAVLRIAARVYERRTAEGTVSVSPGSFSVQYQRDLDQDIIDTLQKYKKFR